MNTILGVTDRNIEKEILLGINERAYEAGIIDYELYTKARADLEKL
ncbi:hypothetical protein SAMN05446037_1006122 [Anaerovirgula multivorans]|uniref:Uncharacterized protein n=1 Tax=Anaerovirgula multivorans TaxID=312168 RepID=A0A239CS35_9FIRM|nr:hypothetical protein [Anaerovirgula multivorans]SNS22907.1 hypothetical protein SAMN05446037_1006122 [Anaerovirgula multivorans]